MKIGNEFNKANGQVVDIDLNEMKKYEKQFIRVQANFRGYQTRKYMGNSMRKQS